MTKNKRIMTINIMNEQLQNKSNHGGGECNVLAQTITTVVKRFINDYNDKQTTTEHRSDAQQTTERTNNTMAVYHRRLLNDKV
jgi:hypothetical protein